MTLCLLALPSPWALAQETPKAPLLDASTYAILRDQIRPTPAEQAFREVGWRTSFGEAVAEAAAAGKPVFLWAMNGHPLACT